MVLPFGFSTSTLEIYLSQKGVAVYYTPKRQVTIFNDVGPRRVHATYFIMHQEKEMVEAMVFIIHPGRCLPQIDVLPAKGT